MGRQRGEKEQIIKDWRESATGAIGALVAFGLALEDWEKRGAIDSEFMGEFSQLCDAGLEGWIDGHPLNVDRLRGVVTGEELPEPEPMTEDAMIAAIFGG